MQTLGLEVRALEFRLKGFGCKVWLGFGVQPSGYYTDSFRWAILHGSSLGACYQSFLGSL